MANLGSGKINAVGGTFGMITGLVGGSAANTLVGPAPASLFTVSGIDQGSVGGVSFSNFGTLVGGAANDSFLVLSGSGLTGGIDGGGGANALTGPSTASAYAVIGTNSGTVGSLKFTKIGSLAGGVGDDTFTFRSGTSLTGSISGGGGTNTIDQSAITTPINANLATGALTGVGGGFSGVQSLIGGSGTTTLAGPVAGST